VGVLLKAIRKIKAIEIASEDDVANGLHTCSSEPYFYDFAYKSSAPKEVTMVDRHNRCLITRPRDPESDECVLYDVVIPIDENGHCILSDSCGDEKSIDGRPKSWKCCDMCKSATSEEVAEILEIKQVFERSLEDVRAFLEQIDSGCKHGTTLS